MPSEPLQDIVDMVESRPELSQEEWEAVGKATPYIKSILKPEVRKELELEYIKRRAAFEEQLLDQNKKMIAEQFEKIRADMEPLGKDELNTLLSQEYLEFKGQYVDESGTQTFVICELPQSREDRFVSLLQSTLVPIIQDQQNMKFRLDGSLLEQINSLVSTVPRAFDAAASIAAVCLDPWEKEPKITRQWVKDTFSTYRISAIIVAQAEANRYRDFFFLGSRTFRSTIPKR